MYAYCGNNPVNRVDVDGESWLALALVVGIGLIAATLSSCNKPKSNNPNNEEAFLEFQEWNGGTLDKDAKIQEAIDATYNKAQEYDHIYEAGCIVFQDKYGYYYRTIAYSSHSENSVKIDTSLTNGNNIVAFIHSHPVHKENIIFNDIELPDPFENYVIDIGKCIYYAAPNSSCYEVQQIQIGNCRVGG